MEQRTALRDAVVVPASWLVGVALAGASIVSLLQHATAVPLAPTLDAAMSVYRLTVEPFFTVIHAPFRWLGVAVPAWFQDVQTLALFATGTLQSAAHPFLDVDERDKASIPVGLALAQGCFSAGVSVLLGYTGLGCLLLPFVAVAMFGGPVVDMDRAHARRVGIMGWATTVPALVFYVANFVLAR